jgi:hypothetical protein
LAKGFDFFSVETRLRLAAAWPWVHVMAVNPSVTNHRSRHERGFQDNHVNRYFLDKPDQQKKQFLIKVGFVGLPCPGAGLCPSEV